MENRYCRCYLIGYRKNLRFDRRNRIKQLELSSVKAIAFETNIRRHFRGEELVDSIGCVRKRGEHKLTHFYAIKYSY